MINTTDNVSGKNNIWHLISGKWHLKFGDIHPKTQKKNRKKIKNKNECTKATKIFFLKNKYLNLN